MKLTERQDTTEVLVSEELEDTEFSVDPEKMGMIFRMFYQYADPISSFVREITSNAIDSHLEAKDFRDLSIQGLVQAGYGKELDKGNATATGPRMEYLLHMKEIFAKWEEKNVEVEMVKGNPFAGTPALIKFHDYGVGLSPERVQKIYSKFGSSTKSATDRQIGAFGLGAKSPLGYTDLFTVLTRWQGTEYRYAVHRTAKAPVIKLLDQSPTDRENGTTVEVAINEDDWLPVQNAVSQQLAYFDGVSFINTGASAGRIFEGDHFLFRENSPFSSIHLCLGKVYYPLQLHLIGVTGVVPPPIALRIPTSCVTGEDPLEDHVSIVWNRESVQYNQTTRDFLKKKYDEAIAELQAMYDAKTKAITNFEEYYFTLVEKKEARIDIWDGVSIPNVNSVIKQKTDYPKFGGLKKLPDDPLVWWEIMRSVDEGKLTNLKHLPGFSSEFRKGSSIYLMGPHASYSPTKNSYINWAGVQYFYLARPKKLSPYDEWKLFGYGYEPDGDTKILIDSFKSEVEEYILRKLPNYDTIEVPREFLDIEKELKKKQKEARRRVVRGDDEFPVRYLKLDHGSYYLAKLKWEMGSMHQMTAETFGGLLIYGFQEDEDRLMKLAPALFSHAKLTNPKTEDLDPEKAMIVRIARGNEKYFKENPNAIHITMFTQRRHKVLIRYVTGYQIVKHLPTGYEALLNPLFKEVDEEVHNAALFIRQYLETYYLRRRSVPNMDEEILEHVSQKERERLALEKKNREIQDKIKSEVTDPNKRRVLFKKHGIPQAPPLFDYYAIGKFKEVKAFMQKYPLVLSLNMANVGVEDLKEYLRLKGRRGIHLYPSQPRT